MESRFAVHYQPEEEVEQVILSMVKTRTAANTGKFFTTYSCILQTIDNRKHFCFQIEPFTKLN